MNMNSMPPPDAATLTTTSAPTSVSLGFITRYLVSKLNKAHISALRLVLKDGQEVMVGHTQPDIPIPTLHIHNNRIILRSWFNGLLGWAEGYMEGDWQCDNLLLLTDWGLHNEAQLEKAFSGQSLAQRLNRLWHRLHNNSKRGSRRNIAYHYDLGNEFYAHWLDTSMSYSAALFTSADQDLATAQHAKYQRILALSEAQPGDHLLEIGCGWGGFAETVANQPDLQLTGITLSQEQLNWAQDRMTALKADERIKLSFCDYRDLTGVYDRIISIEMFEAVGESHWQTYFETLKRSLKSGGTAVLQIICIEENRFEYYRNNTDFIQRYIFPGGMLPPPSRIRELTQEYGLVMEEEQGFGQDYAQTLHLWRQQFLAAWPEIRSLGYDERFRRMWEYYLVYCESGFRYNALDVRLFKIRKP
ncbi:SAM-dependent methyltransferase [Neptunomonas antarctica]|uniref:Cyclopropane-fatty-acyl-phospholipid synthase n=1 Tax=Neptunomonas antarctica TaxID=619304 RepID=A0A1N7IWN0_9GAMM|nr:cyclopropane-fatty-acyl-phospholipid synthase family protein [Neptunomonas antarctica]SIS41495.1 cyclopropane-fatty-acyl-phospholipid synthase [Neptunomonas antarctica]